MNVGYFKMIEKLIDEISEPMLNTATKLVKLELDTLRDKVKLNEEKKELIKLEEKSLFILFSF